MGAVQTINRKIHLKKTGLNTDQGRNMGPACVFIESLAKESDRVEL